jgi:hypothetical protein
MEIDPIILGHNQFIGVDHFTQDRARSRTQMFSETQKIIDIIKEFNHLGGGGMMMSTHPKIKSVVEAINNDPVLSKNFNLYPLIPYAQGYIRKANEKGIMGMLTESLAPADTKTKLKISFNAGINFLKKDIMNLLPTIIDIEMLQFKNSRVNGVILHNVLTDLALAFKARNLFEFYIDYIKDNYHTEPGFGTMNFCHLVNAFDEWEIKKPLILASFNKAGFQMNPSQVECENCLKIHEVNLIAMSTLASGYLKPKEAYDYLFSLPQISSVVVGVSSKEHVHETISLIKTSMEKGIQ